MRVDRHTRAPDGTRTSQTRYFATRLNPNTASAAQLRALVRGHWSVENNLHHEKDRWWDEDRHSCRRAGRAERFTTRLSAAVRVLQARPPGGTDEPLKAQADALNWDIERAVKLLTG